MMRSFIWRNLRSLLIVLALGCHHGAAPRSPAGPYIIILGIAQDGGFPQAGCKHEACRRARQDPSRARHVTSLAIVDSAQRWVIDVTPDFPRQLELLDRVNPTAETLRLDGVFLTHAHVGHYAGLIHFGREVLGTRGVPVHVMPRLAGFLQSNGPWDLLVKLENIRLVALNDGIPVRLNERITITPILVPHRDEYSETVAYRIAGPRRSVLFIPDIDKWERWSESIEEQIAAVDVAYLDATFYAEGELPGRNMAEIPHPFVVETMKRLARLPAAEKAKVRFIHMNHTNPLLDRQSEARKTVVGAGFGIAEEGERVEL